MDEERYDDEESSNLISGQKRDAPADNRHISRAHFVFLIAAILISNLSTAVDSSLSASSHVAVASGFNRTNLSSWPVNAFLLTSTTFQPLYARVSDHLGRKIPYLTASTLFLIGLLLSANTTVWEGLILGRAISGLGVAGVMTMGSVLLTDVVGLEKRGYYQSMNYVVYGTGSALGSAIGGLLVERLGWSYIYKIQLPFAITALVLLALVIPSRSHLMTIRGVKHDPTKSKSPLHNFDWHGSVFLMATLVFLFTFLTTGGNILPWSDPRVILSGLCCAACAGVFVMVENRAEIPILPLKLFISYPMRSLVITGFLFSMINYLVMYNTTMFFQSVLLESAEKAGLRLIIPSVSFTAISAITATIIARTKTPAYTLRGGQFLIVIGTLGLLSMAVLSSSSSRTRIPDFVYNLVLIFPTLGVGMMAPSTVLALLNLSTKENHAIVNGGFIMTRSLGVFVAIALGTTTLQNVFEASIFQYGYDEATRKIIEEVRQKVELIPSLNEPVRLQVMNAYSTAFTVLFALCVLSALLIVISLARLQIRGFENGAYSQKEAPKDEGIELTQQMGEEMEE